MLAARCLANWLAYWGALMEVQHGGELSRMISDAASYISRLQMESWRAKVREWER